MTLALPLPAQAALYRLASRLVLDEPDAALLAALRAPAVLDVLDRAAPGVADDLRDWTPTRAEAVSVAFASLFLLPGGVPPRAEAWLDPAAARPLREHVAGALQRLGREVGDKHGRLPLDHAGLLFDLAAHLLEAGVPTEAEALLAPWVARFASDLAEAEAPSLYRALGQLLTTLHSIPER